MQAHAREDGHGFSEHCLASCTGVDAAFGRRLAAIEKRLKGAPSGEWTSWMAGIRAHLKTASTDAGAKASRGKAAARVRGQMLCLLLTQDGKHMRAGPYFSYGIDVVWPLSSDAVVNTLVRSLLAVARAHQVGSCDAPARARSYPRCARARAHAVWRLLSS